MGKAAIQLIDLPPEIILAVGGFLELRDLNALVQAASRFHALLSSRLYKLGAACVGGETTPLIWAVQNGQLSVIERLLEKGADPSLLAGSTTAFHEAITCGNEDALRLLLETGVNAGIENKRCQTPLYFAAWYNQVNMLRMLLDAQPVPGDIEFSDAVDAAVSQNHVAAARFLLEADAKAHQQPAGIEMQRSFRDMPGYRFLVAASWEGNCDMIKLLVGFGGDRWLRTGSHEKTPLQAAVANQHVDAVRLLISYGLDVEAFDRYEGTPLNMAAARGNLDVVQLLLESGAEIDARDLDDNTPLFSSLLEARLDVAKHLIESGASIDHADAQGNTPLHLAIHCNCDLELIQQLLDAGADVNTPSHDGRTPFILAAGQGRIDMANLLLESGADVRYGGDFGHTALHEAAMQGCVEMIPVLVNAGLDVNSRTTDPGDTPLARAAIHGKSDAMQELLRCGADVNAFPLHVTIKATRLESLEVLLKAGADTSAPNEQGVPPLHYAASISGDLGAVQLLLDYGVDVHALGPDGQTALHYAAQQHDAQPLQLLISAGAHINAQDESGDTALHVAASGQLPATKALLAAGADVSVRAADGSTPLHRAVFELPEIVTELINAGADVFAKDDDGDSPLSLAVTLDTTVFAVLIAHLDDLGSGPDGPTLLEGAAMYGRAGNAKLLLEKGADVNGSIKCYEEQGKHRAFPALHEAIIIRAMEAAECLLAHGADPCYLDLYGRTALDWARTAFQWASDGKILLAKIESHFENHPPTDPAERTAILRTSVVGLATRLLDGEYLNDTPNALTALAQGDGITCNRCEKDLAGAGDRFVCTVCADVDLCRSCMDNLHDWDLGFMFCWDHELLEVGISAGELPRQKELGREEAWKMWLRGLIAEYRELLENPES